MGSIISLITTAIYGIISEGFGMLELIFIILSLLMFLFLIGLLKIIEIEKNLKGGEKELRKLEERLKIYDLLYNTKKDIDNQLINIKADIRSLEEKDEKRNRNK